MKKKPKQLMEAIEYINNQKVKRAKSKEKTAMRWMDFIHYLRGVGCWINCFIDEISEIAPRFQAGAIFHQIGRFASDLKETRKCLMNVHCNSQSVSDIDPRVRSKAMVRVYLPGARSEAYSRIQ